MLYILVVLISDGISLPYQQMLSTAEEGIDDILGLLAMLSILLLMRS